MYDYLLNKRIKLLQPDDSFKASVDSVFLASYASCKKNAKVFEIGFGVGGLGLSLAKFHTDITIDAVEKNNIFYDIGTKNIINNNMEKRVNLKHMCVNDVLKNFGYDQYDCVITNPPYYKKGSRSLSNHKLKNIANMEEISLKQWLKVCISLVKEKGTINIVHTHERMVEIIHILGQYCGKIFVVPIVTNQNSPAKRFLIVAHKGVNGGMFLQNNLIVHGNCENNYSKQAYEILYEMKKQKLQEIK